MEDQYLTAENYSDYILSLKEKEELLEDHLATHGLNCFLVSIDGSASVPLFLIPTRRASGLDHLKHIETCNNIFEEHNICVKLIYTDSGVSNWSALEEGLKKLGIHLCTDPIHEVKNLVNEVRSKEILLDGENVSIQNTLWPFIQDSENLRKLISDKELFPSDPMDQRPIQHLFAILDKTLESSERQSKRQVIVLVKYLLEYVVAFLVISTNKEE